MAAPILLTPRSTRPHPTVVDVARLAHRIGRKRRRSRASSREESKPNPDGPAEGYWGPRKRRASATSCAPVGWVTAAPRLRRATAERIRYRLRPSSIATCTDEGVQATAGRRVPYESSSTRPVSDGVSHVQAVGLLMTARRRPVCGLTAVSCLVGTQPG